MMNATPRFSIWTLLSLVTHAVATLIFLISFSTRSWIVKYWTSSNPTDTYAGLWTYCIEKEIVYTQSLVESRLQNQTCWNYQSTSGKFRATQVFMCFSLISFLVSWLFHASSLRGSYYQKPGKILYSTLALLLLTSFLVMIAVACMADHVQVGLGYSFYLSVFSCLLLVLATILRCSDLVEDTSQSKPPPLNVSSEQGQQAAHAPVYTPPAPPTTTVSSSHLMSSSSVV